MTRRFEPLGPPIMWKSKKDSDYVNFKCVMEGDDSIRDFIRVHCKEEKYKQSRDLPSEEYPHFIFHLYPPVVIQNLLPFEIFIDSIVCVQQIVLVVHKFTDCIMHCMRKFVFISICCIVACGCCYV